MSLKTVSNASIWNFEREENKVFQGFLIQKDCVIKGIENQLFQKFVEYETGLEYYFSGTAITEGLKQRVKVGDKDMALGDTPFLIVFTYLGKVKCKKGTFNQIGVQYDEEITK